MSRRSQLRRRAMNRADGICEWPLCQATLLQMAHIRPSGRGGDPNGDRDVLENVLMLCEYHHDLLDGRQRMNRWEWSSVLLELVKVRDDLVKLRRTR